jgi:hypothetical protein
VRQLAALRRLAPPYGIEFCWGTNDATSGNYASVGLADTGLIIVGAVAYVATYFVVEDLAKLLK